MRLSRPFALALIAGAAAGCGARVALTTDDATGSARGPGVDAGSDGGAVAVHVAPPPIVLPPKKPPEKVKIFVHAVPKSEVYWGKKDLGHTPLTLERPKDSGPMDLVVAARGHFPLHIRAFTFRNDKLEVRLTRLSDRMTLFGARVELPPPAPNPDGTPSAPPKPTVPVTKPAPRPKRR